MHLKFEDYTFIYSSNNNNCSSLIQNYIEPLYV